MSYAADLMALLLLGPRHAVIVAVAGAWTQCTFNVKQRYPLYRTVFSVAAEAITMAATGVGVRRARRTAGAARRRGAREAARRRDRHLLPRQHRPRRAARSRCRPAGTFWQVWRDDFLWSGASFMVAGSAGALAAVVVERGEHWMAVLLLAPVYLTYRTYQLFVGRLEDQKRHMAEMRRCTRRRRGAAQARGGTGAGGGEGAAAVRWRT